MYIRLKKGSRYSKHTASYKLPLCREEEFWAELNMHQGEACKGSFQCKTIHTRRWKGSRKSGGRYTMDNTIRWRHVESLHLKAL